MKKFLANNIVIVTVVLLALSVFSIYNWQKYKKQLAEIDGVEE